MTASDIHDLLVTHLTRNLGGSRHRWKSVVGPVRLYDVATHAHCNWSVSPSGDHYQNAAVERLLDDVRLTHPIVTAG